MTKRQKGFTLIELLIVVAIIGILAAIAIPNLLTAMHRSRQKRTMADLRNIATAWEARATDTNDYALSGADVTWPTPDQEIATLKAGLEPTYMKNVPGNDAWNTPYEYGLAADNQSYSLESLGKDGDEDGGGDSGPIVTTDFDCDIVFSDGNFVQYPEGVQNQ